MEEGICSELSQGGPARRGRVFLSLGLLKGGWVSWPCRSGVQWSHAWDGLCFHMRYRARAAALPVFAGCRKESLPMLHDVDLALFAVGGPGAFHQVLCLKRGP